MNFVALLLFSDHGVRLTILSRAREDVGRLLAELRLGTSEV